MAQSGGGKSTAIRAPQIDKAKLETLITAARADWTRRELEICDSGSPSLGIVAGGTDLLAVLSNIGLYFKKLQTEPIGLDTLLLEYRGHPTYRAFRTANTIS